MLKPGETIGKWTLLAQLPARGRSKWQCRCECGTERAVNATHLKTGASSSCGCSRRRAITHGAAMGQLQGKRLPPEYQSWRAMRERCHNPNGEHWHLYGGRGIKICDQWSDFATFLADMGPKPTPQHTIERIDTDGHYEPSNCRWATQKEQCRNFSRNRHLTFRGQTRTMAEWAEHTGLPYSALNSRIHRGWPAELALTRPLGRWL